LILVDDDNPDRSEIGLDGVGEPRLLPEADLAGVVIVVVESIEVEVRWPHVEKFTRPARGDERRPARDAAVGRYELLQPDGRGGSAPAGSRRLGVGIGAEIVDELPRPDFKTAGEAQNRGQARLARPALEAADCCRVDVCLAREVVL
jgi:hypothetical protein